MAAKFFDFKNMNLVLPLATAIGAWGGFPEAPKFFKDLVSEYKFIPWLLTGILIWQGGGGQKIPVSVMTLAIVYLLTIGLKKWEEKRKQRLMAQ